MQRRPDFSFPPGSPARGLLLPPLPPPAAHPDEEEVRWLHASAQGSPDYGSSSGTPSPQLWAAAHHHRTMGVYTYPASAGASPSRAQAIAGYRREMLDLVRGLPESAYELSLRDIVDRPAPAASPPHPALPSPPPSAAAAAAAAAAPRGDAEAKDAVVVAAAADDGSSKGKRQGRKQRAMRRQRSRSLERSVSLDTGLLIKLFLPLSIAGGRKKVSPKPDAAKDGKKKKAKKQGNKKTKKEAAVAAPAQEEEEWWAKSESSEAGAGSSRTSSTGSSSNSSGGTASIRIVNGAGAGGANPRAPARSWSRKRTGCYAFFRANKGKTGVNQD